MFGTLEEAREIFSQYEHVVLVCEYDKKVVHEKIENPWSTVHSRATVIKSFKGNLRIGDIISYAHFHDQYVSYTPEPGGIYIIRTDQDVTKEFGLDAGDALNYSQEIVELIETILNAKNL